jgi:DEAD/DEAH box helicase domain-containing protein
VGLAQRGFDAILGLLEKTWEVIKGCPCEEGCPSCIHSPKCGSGDKPLDKGAARLILEGLLGHIPLSDMSNAEDRAPLKRLSDQAIPPEETKGPRVLYLDLETQKTAQEVGGWQNSHLMRISVAVLFDSIQNDFLIFEEGRVDDLLAYLKKGDLIIGFNIKQFDYRVLGAYSERDLSNLPTFDILEDVHRRLGFRLGLDHLATETLKQGKTADGLQAVEWFRQGEMEKLTDYCRHDVAATRDLFLYGLENGHLVYRKKGHDTRLRLLVDWDLDNLMRRNSS